MTHMDRSVLVPALTNIATRLRIDSVLATSATGTGHPTSCASAAELLRALTRVQKLHADPDYRAAVGREAGGMDTAESARLAEAFDGWRGDTRAAAHVGLALLGRFALGPDLQ